MGEVYRRQAEREAEVASGTSAEFYLGDIDENSFLVMREIKMHFALEPLLSP